MGLRDTLYFWSLTLLTVTGFRGARGFPSICALRGAAVIIPCSDSYLESETGPLELGSVIWCRKHSDCDPGTFQDVCKNVYNRLRVVSPQFWSRAECSGDPPDACFLNITDVAEQDAGMYVFTLNGKRADFSPLPKLLYITELRAEMTSSRRTETVMEGDSVDLTCTTEKCSFNQSQLTWLKNGKVLPGQDSRLELNSVSYQDSGSYSCALKENPHTSSNKILLDVQYPPRNMSVLVSPSGEPVEGSSVTLTCSSEANPPADSYTWFKIGAVALVTGRGQSYTITNIRPEDSGLYYCRAENKHGALNSDARTLTVADCTTVHVLNNTCYGGKVNAFLIVTGILLPVIVAVTVIIIYVKRRKATQRGERTQAGHPDPHNDLYADLDLQNMSPDYNTLQSVGDADKPSTWQDNSTRGVYEAIN